MSATKHSTVFTAVALVASVWIQAALAASDADEAALQAAYEAILEDPGSIARTMEYARIATEVGDYEAAIGALERILLLSPDQHKVRANLGILYYRLQSYEAGRHHLEQALASGELPEGLAERVEYALGEAEKGVSRHDFGGSISFGLRYRDNANAGPRSSVVMARGFSVSLDDEFQEESDGDFFIVGNAIHRYDLDQKNRAAIETDGAFYANRQFDIEDIDNITAEISPGVRLWLRPEDRQELSVRPHFVINVMARGDDLFSNVYGAGMDLRYRPSDRAVTGGKFQHRQREYHDSDDRPLADERDGHENFGMVYVRYAFHPKLSVLGRVNVIDRHAKREFHDSVEVGALARVDLTYSSPLNFGAERALPFGRNWRAYASVIYRNLDFDTPNPRTDPSKARNDDEWRVSLGNAMPITRRWRVNLEASYSEVGSNIANFERNNLSVALSATRRF
jgi:tetratricopeptide (TPR) repeat protein